MRLRFFLCASADLGVRRSKVASSFCRSAYIEVLREDSGGPLPGGGPLECPGGRSRPGWYIICALEKEFQCELHQPRIASRQHLPERRVREVAIRIHEFRLVEEVEDIGSELEVLRFRQRNPFRYRDVPLILARAAANRSRRRCKRSQRRVGELRLIRVKEVVPA